MVLGRTIRLRALHHVRVVNEVVMTSGHAGVVAGRRVNKDKGFGHDG